MKKLSILVLLTSLLCLSSCEKNENSPAGKLKEAIKLVDDVLDGSLDDAISKFKAFGATETQLKGDDYYCFYGLVDGASGHVHFSKNIVYYVDINADYDGKNTFPKAKSLATAWLEQMGEYYEGKHNFEFNYAQIDSSSKIYDYSQACKALKDMTASEKSSVSFVAYYTCGSVSMTISLRDYYKEESLAQIAIE